MRKGDNWIEIGYAPMVNDPENLNKGVKKNEIRHSFRLDSHSANASPQKQGWPSIDFSILKYLYVCVSAQGEVIAEYLFLASFAVCGLEISVLTRSVWIRLKIEFKKAKIKN